MKAAALLALLVAVPARAGDCPGAYKDEWQAMWRISRADWQKACAKNDDPANLLYSFQRGWIDDCTRRFTDAVVDGKVSADRAQAACAEGVDAADQLAASLDIPSDKPLPPPPPPRPPAAEDMGPVGRALVAARQGWRPDACLAAMCYGYYMAALVQIDPSDRAKTISAPGPLEDYSYYFWSRSRPNGAYRVRWSDKEDPAFFILKSRLAGPEAGDSAYVTTGGCLTGSGIGLERALSAAQAAGLGTGPGDTLKAYLLSPG
ncbi:MAG: hypothetical protein KGL53_10095, partial [Elusimicrobia bacterium]|nr:hypothetical protein [Elusimicrobiota bacterium]